MSGLIWFLRGLLSDRGRADWAISRSGWFRTTVELPSGTRAGAMEYGAVQCVGLKTDDNAEPEASERANRRVEAGKRCGSRPIHEKALQPS